jgi:general secretion pathway protein B
MSLILEALKKSEQQRQLGEAPNLGTPITMTRRRRSLLPVLAAAIAIALGASWYLLRNRRTQRPQLRKSPARRQRRPRAATPPQRPRQSLPRRSRSP